MSDQQLDRVTSALMGQQEIAAHDRARREMTVILSRPLAGLERITQEDWDNAE